MATSTQEGSEKIGEGSYGCVLRPPPHCAKSKNRSGTKAVGKILLKTNAKIELQIGALVKSIPDWEKYYIVQEEEDCDPANFKRIRSEYIEECKILQSGMIRDKNLTQVVSRYGGKTLADTLPTSTFDYMRALKHMLEGIWKLQKQGICHYDLKENNIVVDEHSTLRIIDFGGSFVGDAVTAETVRNHVYSFMPEYNTQPPELSVQNGLNDGGYSRMELYRYSVYKKYTFTQMESLLGVSKSAAETELAAFWNSYDGSPGWAEFFRTYWRTWDSWAVGVIFLKIWKRCLLYDTFIKNTLVPHGTVLKGVLRGLLEVDPRKRLLPEKALELLGA